jgi:cell division protein FtsB
MRFAMIYIRKKWAAAIILLALFILVYMVVIFIQQQSMINANKDKIEAVNDQVSEQQVLQQKLQDENKNALTDQSIEHIAREILGMVKPGEKVYIETEN